MSIDDYLKGVDTKILAIDEIEKLKSELENWEKRSEESARRIKELKYALYEQKDAEIKNAIIEVCKKKSIDFKENGEILQLSYKGILKFTINLSEKTRFISRTESDKINLSLHLKYILDTEKHRPSSSISYTSEKEGLELQINRYKQNIEFDKELIGAIDNKNMKIEIEIEHKQPRILKSINELIEVMFN